MLEIMSVPTASAPARPDRRVPLGSIRERFRRYTPVKVTKKPQRRESVVTVSVVLNPLNRIKEAHSVAVVKVTKYNGLTL